MAQGSISRLILISQYTVRTVLTTIPHQNHSNAISILSYHEASRAGLGWINMVNKAGKVVSPNETTISAALSEYAPILTQSNFSADIYDGASDLAWPIPLLSFFVLRNNETIDCTVVEEELAFLSWIYTNDG